MSTKIRPSEQKRKALSALMEQEGKLALEAFHQLGQERLYQEALEAEVDEFLGRSWHQRREKEQQGYRNGYYQRTIAAPGTRLEVSVPRVRNVREPFVSRLLKGCIQLTERIRRMALEMYVRGLSTRDVEEAFVDQRGSPMFSRSTISRLSERLYDEYRDFSGRDLSKLDVVFVFVDGVYEAVKRYTNGQTLLCAWAICADGKKEFLHLAAVQSESQEAWEAFFADLQRRGLRRPNCWPSGSSISMPTSIPPPCSVSPKIWTRA
jgi:transposase-like protein